MFFFFAAPVIVTSTTHSQGPYPVSVQGVPQMHGVGYPPVPHQQGFAPSPYQMSQPGGYPPMPQPQTGFHPMPQPGGYQPQFPAPYPPVNQSAGLYFIRFLLFLLFNGFSFTYSNNESSFIRPSSTRRSIPKTSTF